MSDVVGNEQLKKALLANWTDYKLDDWPQKRRVWLMGKVICDLKGNINPVYLLSYIDDFIEKRRSK